MNLRRLRSILFCVSITVSLTSSLIAQSTVKKEDEPGLQDLREEYFYGPRRDLTGHIPPGARANAIRSMQQMEADAAAAALKSTADPNGVPLSTTNWTMVGPQPTTTLGNEFFSATSGRISALAVDPTDANIVYVGAAMGGVWKTTDGGANWTPLTDSQPSLAIGSLAIDPNNHLVIYAGTGEENFSSDSYYGAGILKSTDGGASWTNITGPFGGPFATNLGGSFIGGIAVSPSNGQVLLASVRLFTNFGSGIFRSTNGGATWTEVLTSSTVPALTNSFGTSVVFDPSNGNIAYAGIGRPGASVAEAGVYRSTDGGATWSKLPGTGANLFPTANVGRVVIAISPSSPTTLYVGVGHATANTLLGVFKTTDSGTNWTALGATPDYCAGSNPQCNYDNALAVHPTNPNVVFAGGQDVGAPGVRGTSLFATFNGGTSWTAVSPGPGAGAEGLHPDTHAIVFSATGAKMYTGNDGGVWSTSNTTSSPVTWTNLNATLAITQFYPGLSFHPSNLDVAFGGTQDNGTQKSSATVLWSNPNACGDGGWTAIDFSAPTNVYTTCQLIDVEKSTTGGANNSFNQVISGINGADRVLFIPPLVMDPSNALTLYFGTFKLYQTTNGAGSWTAMAAAADLTGAGGTGRISAIAVAPSDPNTVYVGANNGTMSVGTNASAGAGASFVTRITGLPPTRMVTNIAVDPTNANTAYATFSGFSGTNPNFADNLGHVFKTTNAGGLWTDISGNLPNIPANDIVIDPDLPNTLYVATDIGVFQSVNGGTTWTTLGSGLPRVAVLSLKLHHPTRVLRAATHGRSAWDLQLTAVVTVSPTPLHFGNQPINSTSTAQTVTFTNGSNAAVTVTSVVPSAGFNVLNSNCGGGPVAANGGTCTFQVNFAPTSLGFQTGTVTVTDSGVGSPRTLNVDGTGTAAGIPCSINFNNGAGTLLWTTATNWDLNRIPAAGDNACIGGAFAVTLTTGVNVVDTLQVTSTAVFTMSGGSLQLNANGSTVGAGGYTQSGGTLTGIGSLTVSGPLSWTNGVMSGAGVTNANGGLTLGGIGNTTLDTRTMNNNGTATLTGGSSGLGLATGAVFNNLAGSIFNIVTDTGMFNAGGSGTFNNAGALNKNGGAVGSTIGIAFNNTGAVAVNASALNLSNGSTSSGAFTITGGNTLNFNGGTHNLNAGSTISGAGTTNINSTVNFNTNSSLSTALTLVGGTATISTGNPVTLPTLTQSGGTLGGTDTVTVNGLMTWSSGVQNGTGNTIVRGGMTLSGVGNVTLDTRSMSNSNNGTANLSGNASGLGFAGGAVFTNTAGATFNLQSDTGMFNAGGSGNFANAGTFNKAAGAGTSTVGIGFNNTGSTHVNSGTLTLSGGGTCGGTCGGAFSTVAGATLGLGGGMVLSGPVTGAGTVNFPNGAVTLSGTYNVTGGTSCTGATATFPAGATVTSTGPLTITAGTLNFSGGTPISTASITQSGGTLTGSDTINVSGPLSWTNGVMSGTGVTNANGGLTLGGIGNTTLDTRTMNNNGTATLTGNASGLGMANGAVFNNLAGSTFNIVTDTGMFNAGGSGTFNNAGALNKNGGAVGSTIGIAFNNTGAVAVNASALNLSNGSTSSGAFTITGGNTLNFNGGTHNLNAGSTISGAGTTNINSTVNFNTNSSLSTALTLVGGTATISTGNPVTLPTLTQSGGTLGGTDTVTVNGLMTWSNGVQNGTGNTIVRGGMTLSGVGNVTLDTRSMSNSNNGTANLSGNASGLGFAGGAVFTNTAGATFNLQSDTGMFNAGGSGNFANAGTFNKAAGAGTSTVGIGFNNTGSTHVNSGTLTLSGGGTCGGTCGGAFSTVAGATLGLGGGMVLSGPVTGAGTVNFPNGAVTLSGTYNVTGGTSCTGATATFPAGATVTSTGPLTITAGTLNFSGGTPISTASITQSGGTLTGSDTINVSGPLSWTNGVMSGTGVTNANGGLTLGGIGNTTLDTRTMNNNGTATLTGNASGLGMANGAVFNNLAGSTFNIVTDTGMFNAGGSGTFNNAGALNKNGGAVGSTIGIAFNNTGAVAVNASALNLSNGSTSSGAFTITGGNTLNFNGGTHNLNAGSTISGAGTTNINSTVNFNTNSSLSTALTLVGGTATISTGNPVTLPTLTQSGGTLGGTDTVTVNGLMTWSNGVQNGTGNTIVRGGMTLSGVGNVTLDTRSMSNSNNGTANLSGNASGLGFAGGAVFTNTAGATFNLQSDTGMFNAGGSGTFANAGTFNKAAGAGTSTLAVIFNSTGPFNLNTGALNMNTGGTFSGAVNIAGSLQLSGGTYNLNAGSTIHGAGTFLVNGGTVNLNPGSAFNTTGPLSVTLGILTLNSGAVASSGAVNMTGGVLQGTGVLNVTGGYSQSSGTLTTVIGGTNPGQFGQFNMTAGTTLGTNTILNVSLANGFAPAGGDSYTVMTFPSRTGTFTSVVLPPLGANQAWNVAQNATSIVLTVVQTAPPILSKAFGGATMPLNGSTSLSFTIQNPNGGTSLTGVGFTDTLPSGMTVATPNGLTGTCGGGAISATAGTGTVSLSNATLASNASCTFAVNVTATTVGTKNNTTSAVTSNEVGGGNTASASVLVVGPPVIIKAFGAASIPLNGSTSLSFTIQNNNTTTTLTGVAFSDTFPAGLVVSTPNALTGSCGGGTITATQGTTVVTLLGASLAASTSCTFSVNVTGAAAGLKNNTTGNVTSTEGGTGGTASSSVKVEAPPSIAKVFNPSTVALNATTSLTFTITNPAANADPLTGVAFTDTLPTGLTVANSTATVCGGTLTTTAPTGIALTGATINTNSQCQFSVTVTAAASGQYTNTTGNVTSTNGGIGNTATANLSVAIPPTIAKAFGAAQIPLNGTTSLTFSIQNPNIGLTLTGLSFTDNLPAGLVVATPNGVSSTCGGATTATAGSGSVSLAGGSLAGNASCTVSVNVAGTTAGQKNNSVTVTANESGAGNTSNASITVVAPPTVAKAFGAASIPLNGSTSLSFTINNPNATTALSGIGFTDSLPAGVVVSTPNGLTGACGGGTITTTAGTSTVTLAGATLAGATSCTFSVNVTGTTAGTKNNTTSTVSSVEGGSGAAASASITVVAPPTISKAFGVASTSISVPTSLSFTITNPAANTVGLTGVAFTDTLPSGMVVATPNALTGTCGGGTITATAASGSVSLAGATIAAGASCTFSVNVASNAGGVYTNTTSAVTSTNGGTGLTTTASITVTSAPPDFTVTSPATGTPVQTPAGGKAVVMITTTGLNGFAGTITFACASGLPAKAECLFPNGASLTLPGANNTFEVDIATVSNSTFLARSNQSRGLFGMWLSFPGILVAGLCLVGRKRKGGRFTIPIFGAAFVLLLMMSSCGDGRSGFSGTPPGTYNITVSATSGAIQHQVVVAVKVQ